MKDSNHDSNDASKKSFGHIPTVGVILLAGIIGLFKHADNIVRPILKGGDDAASVFVRNSDEFARYSGNGNDSSVFTGIHPYLVGKGAQVAVRGAQSAEKDDGKPVVFGQRDSMIETQPFPQITMPVSDLKGTYTENTNYYTRANDIVPDIIHRNDATAVRE